MSLFVTHSEKVALLEDEISSLRQEIADLEKALQASQRGQGFAFKAQQERVKGGEKVAYIERVAPSEVKALRLSGLSLKALARHFEVSLSTIKRRLKASREAAEASDSSVLASWHSIGDTGSTGTQVSGVTVSGGSSGTHIKKERKKVSDFEILRRWR